MDKPTRCGQYLKIRCALEDQPTYRTKHVPMNPRQYRAILDAVHAHRATCIICRPR